MAVTIMKKPGDANRKNAQLSTGPKSKAGKARSSMNACKHGLTAKSVILPWEDREEFNAFREALYEDLNPETAIQGQYVDLIVADFDFRLTPAADATRADGFGFALLRTFDKDVPTKPLYGTTGCVPPEAPLFAAEEPGFQQSLGIGFDIHQGVGDVNKNGTVDAIDAQLILQFEAGLLNSISNADVNEDGTVDSIDAVLILQFTAGLLNSLPP